MILRKNLLAAARCLRAGTHSPRDLLEGCLENIERHESHLRAWVELDLASARADADRLGAELRAGRDRGPLHGIPLGIKDIVDVAGLPTRAGSPLTDPRPAERDATAVARWRAAGGIIVGKTVTTEFACFDPPPTLNPWNPAHTPGGSSSGSAAGVATAMCFGAIATQTGGSVTRPASFCGVSSFKPTLGRVSRAGVVPVSFHLDHIGAIARSLADCALLTAAMAGPDPRDSACSTRSTFAWPNLVGEETALSFERPPRLGVMRSYFFDTIDAETVSLTNAAIKKLAAAGCEVVEVPLPREFEQVHAMHRRIMACDAAEFHRRTFGAPRAGYGPTIAGLIDEGFAVTMAEYQEALAHQVAFRHATERALEGVDALITPATPGPAPASLATTGDSRFNAPWSHAGLPTASLPIALTASGMPLSLQLIGRPWSEAELLRTGIWCEGEMNFTAQPPCCS